MKQQVRRSKSSQESRWYRGADVPKSIIRRFAREVVERFDPDKIVLFGSHAYGKPHADSDVDILVVMPARNQLDQAFKIHDALRPPFPLDIIVRTPKNIAWRLMEGESFHSEILKKGKVLYAKGDTRVGSQSRKRSSSRRSNRRRKRAVS
jgi:predicted nucleotidyltransferase